MFSTLLTNLALLSATGWASYVLEDDYMSGNFFDQFSFFDGADPTNGFVSYAGKDDNLISGGTGGYASFGVDNSTNTPGGRPSVRLTSNKSYQSGLFVLDVAHMPGGICGTWPAFWTVGPDWPNQGEIDIIEGVNDQNANDMSKSTDLVSVSIFSRHLLTRWLKLYTPAPAAQSAVETPIPNPTPPSPGLSCPPTA